jgi:RNA polymerase sigma-70 factor, ECF subfamily
VRIREHGDVHTAIEARRARFEAVFDGHYRAVWAYCRRRVPPDEADDAVAEVFTTAWRRFDDVPTDRALPWLYGVAHNHVAHSIRRRQRAGRLNDRLRTVDNVVHLDRDRDDAIDASARFDVVTKALATLRPDDQEILRLAAWEDLAPADIAVVLGCSANAAAVRLHRARRRLEEAIDMKEVATIGNKWTQQMPTTKTEGRKP